jgi:hypothetical protein
VTKKPAVYLVLALLATVGTAHVSAQTVETVGSRALGMGGAFVAVANDSSATWWNPGALAAGPFLDITLARTVTDVTGGLPARRDRATSFAIGTPPFGFSYYRLRVTDIRPFDPTGGTDPDREDRRAGVPVRSLSVGQLGATLVHTLVPGVHAGTTLKYLRGTVLSARDDGLLDPSDLLDRGEDLGGGDTAGQFDLDIGVLAIAGPVRVGAVVRNLRAPAFGEVHLPRQIRVGAAVDAEAAGGVPLILAVDADVKAYDASVGDRRVIAMGGEQWLFARRLGVRAGARFNSAGPRDKAATGGVTVAPRPGLYLDGHVVRGAGSEQGWGIAARVSF